MRIDINSIVKSARVLAKNAAKGIAKNKHAIIEGGLSKYALDWSDDRWIEEQRM